MKPWKSSDRAGDGRYFVIGDVHGCAVELEELLNLIAPGADDQICFLGDLVNRGPDSRRVLAMVAALESARWVMGNHELRWLHWRETRESPVTREDEKNSLAGLEAGGWDLLERAERFIEFPDLQSVLVHGGFVPGQDWRVEPLETVVNLAHYNPKTGGFGRKNSTPGGSFWLEHWTGPPYVLCGHTPAEQVAGGNWGCGLDTGCVYGGRLTAMELRSGELFQVRARENYIGKPLPKQRSPAEG